MRSKMIMVLMVMMGMFVFSFPSHVFGGEGRMEQAQGYLNGQMWEEAIKVLKQEIQENPENAQAHFKLGLAYFRKSGGETRESMTFFLNKNQDFQKSIKRFQAADGLESEYGDEASCILIRSAKQSARKERYKEVDELLKYAHKLGGCSLMKDLGEHFLKTGTRLLRPDSFKTGRIYLNLARKADPGLNKEVGKIVSTQRTEAETEWKTVKVTKDQKELIRIFEGDKFYYKSPHEFKIGNKGNLYSHDASSEPGEVRGFDFYNVEEGGEKIYIKSEEAPFKFEFKIEQ